MYFRRAKKKPIKNQTGTKIKRGVEADTSIILQQSIRRTVN